MKKERLTNQIKNINKRIKFITITALVAIVTIVGVYLKNQGNKLSLIDSDNGKLMEYKQVQQGDENVEGTNENVKFDAFFLRDINEDGVSEAIRGTYNKIGEEDTLHMELKVQTDGYLKDGVITINSKNFYLTTNLSKDEVIADNYIDNNTKVINLNTVMSETQKTITGTVRSGDYSETSKISEALDNDINNYSKINNVTLTGTYVNNNGEETQINKKVVFNVDWYSEETTNNSLYMINALAENSNIKSIDLTGLVTGEDVSHTHIYEKKYDDNYHWEECFICGNVRNKEAHDLETTGSGLCGTYYVTQCKDGCGYNKSEYVDHEIEYYDKSQYTTNTATYYHIIGHCKKCGSESAASLDGNSTNQFCTDSNGNLINCANRKTCVVCGYDYSKLAAISHDSCLTRQTDNVVYCQHCGKEITKVVYKEAVQDSSNSLHWTIRGIFQLLGNIQWNNTELATYSDSLASGAFESLGNAHVTNLPSEYYNNAKYGTLGISSGLYMVTFDAYIKNGYQGTPYVRLNADNCFKNVNGNSNEFAKTYELIFTLSPDKTAPNITSYNVNKGDIIDGWSQKATITVNAYDSYSDTVSVALYHLDGKCIADYGTATNNGDRTFTRTFDIVAEVRGEQTLVVKARDRYGNETSKNIQVQNIDAVGPTLVSEKSYTQTWSKNKTITFSAQDLGVEGVQIAFNNENDYQLATQEGENWNRTYNFYGDVYDKVTAAIYLKDKLGNTNMVKVDIGKLDGTAPTITSATYTNGTVDIVANDEHPQFGTGSGVASYKYVTSMTDENIVIDESTQAMVTTSNQIPDSNLYNAKYVYIAAVDAVGNIGNTVKVELPTYSYTVNYYEQGTNTKVANSKTVNEKALGESITESAIDIKGYNKIDPTSKSITIGKADNIINFYYSKVSTSVTVHYYKENTTTKLCDDIVINGYYGDPYETTESENVPKSYKLVSTVGNTLGTMIENPIEVIYYYRLITTDVTVTKVWNHTNNIYTKPSQVKLLLKNGSSTVGTIVLNSNNFTGDTWTYTFPNVQQYTDSGNLINYTVDEEEVNKGDLDYYSKQINGTKITNTYIGPVISSTKSATTEHGLAYVVEGEKITYTITVKNDGEIGKEVEVKDKIPEGTTFITGSIKVKGQETNSTAEELASGITINIGAGEKTTLEFKVRVNDLDNGTKIRNIATVDDRQTNETEYTYVEPIISSEKTATTEHGLAYVVEGEKITYCITVRNDGDLSKDVKIKDRVPEGTTLVSGSIKVNNAKTENTEANLEEGITVNIPARGRSTVTFEVTVDELPANSFEREIKNTAIIDETQTTDKVTIEVKKPNVEISKSASPTTENVVLGQEITYTITLDNSKGTAPTTVKVQDTVPAGTTFITGSIKVKGQVTNNTAEELASGISIDIGVGEKTTLEFKVKVMDLDNGAKIENIATVDDRPTNETEYTYVEPIISSEKTATTEKGLDYVVEGEKITYCITVRNDGDLSKDVKIQDTIPEGTSYIEGSIKLNDEITENTKENLEEGITVNVPARGRATVTFEVKVDELEENIYEKEIENTAIIDETQTTDKVTIEVNKPYVEISKSASPANGRVLLGQEITYYITFNNNKGTAPITLSVKDDIPLGTTFVNRSIKINGIETSNTLEDLTTNGITVNVLARKTTIVEFKVRVNDLEDGYIIRNAATIINPETKEEKTTNEVTHEYVEAQISAIKDVTTENGLSYAVAGEKLTYTIRINNTGNLGKEIKVQDKIPEGTTLVEDSIQINGEKLSISQAQLENGFEIEISAKQEIIISFQVIVEEGADEITNKAIVDGQETNETKLPVFSYEKIATIIRQTEEEIPEGTVTAGDKIKYTIRINNLGEETVTNVIVKDVIPEGTTISKIGNSGVINNKNEITWTIANIAGNEYAEVSFEVTVNYDIVDNKSITNVATVDGEETNEVEISYGKPEIKEESTIEKTGTEIIDSTENSVTYKVTYDAKIKDYVGKGKVKIIDQLPYILDEDLSNLDGGKYDEGTKTITWEEDLGSIDTYINGEKTIIIEKEITLKYEYGEDAEILNGTLINRVEGKLELTQENPDKPGEDVVVKEDTVEDTYETKVQIPTHIVVHHYIEGTSTKVPSKVYGEVVEDETTDGYVGEDYTTSASSNVQENYKVVSNSGNISGTMTRTPIEIIYYYKLQPGDITENTIEKLGTDKVINKDDKASYEITYMGKVENYVGDVKVEIIDYLPYEIDESVSNLNGGTYNSDNNTITWLEDLGRVNTYTDGKKEITITKNIEVVFTQMDYIGTGFTNRAQGKIILEETKQEQDTPEVSKETQTEFVKDVTVEKVWDDNSDIKGRRPDSVTVQLTADGETTYKDEELEKVVLDEGNGWTHTFSDLPKYTEEGQEIAYSVVETETNEGDLEYYENPDVEVFNSDSLVTVRVTNSYKLMDTNLDANIEKAGTELVTSSKDEVSYNIKYNATVKDYIGESLVTITDYLPYAIDENLSELDGGTYDSLTNTITWTENIEHINTYEYGDYEVSIEKNIKVVFTNLDATVRTMTNRVTGKIDLYETEKTNIIEDTYETKVEIPGKIIVKYVDKETGKEITYEEQNEEGQIEEKTYGYELNGLAGDTYSTEQKDIYGYTFVEDTKNTSGNMKEGTIEVIYYYERTNAGGVIVHYVDEEGNKLTEDEVISGKVADPYKTEQKEIPNYDFVRVEGQTEGELVEETLEVTYIYKKIPAKVIVQYLEKDDTPDDDTDNVVLAEQEIIEGYSGDSYSTERKEIENFKLFGEIPENAKGTMTREDIYVIYYYERKPSGIVTVKYVDVDTNEEILQKVAEEDGEKYITYREQAKNFCGISYETIQKDIPYYNFVEELRPANAKGIFTEDDIDVIYYYSKQEFNLSVEKQIERITVNGVEHSLKEELNQIDVVASKVQETDIVVTYKIIVRNPSEIAGTATVIDKIPEFFKATEGTSIEWSQTDDKILEAEVELETGETEELLVVLRWIKDSNNFGLQVNTVTLKDVTNEANFEEINLEDSISTAAVILSVKTGGINTSIIFGITLTAMVGVLIIMIYLVKRNSINS